MSFDSIPILDLSLSRDPKTKPAFLDSLRHALLEVGFLYISNVGIEQSLIDEVINNGKAFFDLPNEAKLAVQMKNQKSFLGES
jgi:isopenicillin N synthase-like dioxygenase